MLDPRLKDWWRRDQQEQRRRNLLQKTVFPIIRKSAPSSIRGQLLSEFPMDSSMDSIMYIKPIYSNKENK